MNSSFFSDPVLCYDSECRSGNAPDAIWCRKCGKLLSLAGRYSILGRVSGNPMWDLYRAWDTQGNSEVMIKCYSPVRPRAQREIHIGRQALQKLVPHLVRVSDEIDLDGRKFVVHNRLEGETLCEIWRREAFLPFSRKLAIAWNLCTALQSLHLLPAVHGDVKPSSVHVGPENQVTILDIGAIDQDSAAHFMDEREYDRDHLAPEMAQSGYIPSPSADVFSVGVILYELFHGGPPHDMSALDKIPAESETYRLKMREIKGSPVDFHTRCPEAPESLRPPLCSAILSCLSSAPEKRPRASELAERLRSCHELYEQFAARHVAASNLGISEKADGLPREGATIRSAQGVRYRLIERVGHGTDSFRRKNYRSLRIDDGKSVEIGILSSQNLIADRSEVQRFLLGGWALMQFAHPNILKVYDLGMLSVPGRDRTPSLDLRGDAPAAPGCYFFQAKEYFPCCNLKDWLASTPSKKMPCGQALRVMLDVCRALMHVAECDSIRFEMKPAHIGIGEGDSIRLLQDGLKIEGWDIGTEESPYSAPEQVGLDMNEKSYIYQLGATFYYLVTGIPTFAETAQGKMSREVLKRLRKIRRKRLPTPPSVVESSVPDRVSRAILRMLQPDPSRRFPNLRETLAALQELGKDAS